MNNKPVQDIGESLNKIKQNSKPYVPIKPYNPVKQYMPETSTPKRSNFFLLLSLGLIAGVILFIIIFAIYYYKESCKNKVSFSSYLGGFDVSTSPCKKAVHKPTLILDKKHKKEVYHIGDQLYTYKQAQCKCKSYGGKLATKNEVIHAYNKGANWCSYGWSEGQSAYYPTQKCEWNKLQKTKNKEKCGNPGVNGGRFPENIRFGVNCYGYKPEGKKMKEKAPVCSEKNVPFCKQDSNKDVVGISTTDELVDFNNEKWSIYDN